MNKEETRALVEAQHEHCRKINVPMFIPKDGICFRCGRNIFEDATMKNTYTGREYVSRGYKNIVSSELITGCPHCCWSYCD